MYYSLIKMVGFAPEIKFESKTYRPTLRVFSTISHIQRIRVH